jgi:hypothetical protein
MVFEDDARAELADLGGLSRLIGAYLAGAIPCGVVLGVFRPLARTWIGRCVLGGLITTVGFGSFHAVLLGITEQMQYAAIIFPLYFVVGAVMSQARRGCRILIG